MMQKKNFRISITIDKKVVVKDFYTKAAALEWKLKIIESKLNYIPIEGETFKPIEGFSRYMASNYGRIISLDYKRSGAKKLINPSASKDGYLQSMFLNDNGKYATKKIHKLVAIAFYGVCTYRPRLRGRKQLYFGEQRHASGTCRAWKLRRCRRYDSGSPVCKSRRVCHAWRR